MLLADTVGFIHKLPHQLVEAFKSTLEEVRSADLLLHVVDVSHPHWEEQAAVVESVLAEIGADTLPTVRALNKIDALPGSSSPTGGRRRCDRHLGATGAGIPGLLAAMETSVTRDLERVSCTLPSARGDLLAWLRRSGRIVEEHYDDGVVRVTALVPPKVAGQLRKRVAQAGQACTSSTFRTSSPCCGSSRFPSSSSCSRTCATDGRSACSSARASPTGSTARSRGSRTPRPTLGAYLDPLADKLLLVSSFIALGFMDVVPRWLVVVVSCAT